MKWLENLFNKNKQAPVKTPSWEKIIEIMYDKNLTCFEDEIAGILYSHDKSKRYVILKTESGIYKYCYEEIMPFEEDELVWIGYDSSEQNNVLPAQWIELGGGHSFFSTMERAINNIQSETAYKEFFI